MRHRPTSVVALVGYRAEPPLQLVYGAAGMTIVGLASLPSVERELEQVA